MNTVVARSVAASLAANPRWMQWLDFSEPGIVGIRTGKVELGQGIHTALSQIVADGLALPLAQVKVRMVHTAESANEGVTSGSLSVQDSGGALAIVCAQVLACLQAARRAEASLDYWTLWARGGLDQSTQVETSVAPNSEGAAFAGHPPARLVGANVPRLDLPAKLRGEPVYLHDLRLPGTCFGRVVHRPRPDARLHLADLALEQVRALPGVLHVVRDGDWLGLVAEDEWSACQAHERLLGHATWVGGELTLPEHGVTDWLLHAPRETSVIASQGQSDAQDPNQPRGERAWTATYSKPYIAHASMGTSCAVARWDAGPQRMQVWSHTQGVFNLRADLAMVLALPVEHIEVQHVQGAGCYGHNGADDVALDAALLARVVPGRPVHVQWTRAQELGNAPFGPAMAVRLAAAWEPDGSLRSWQHEVWSNGHALRPGRGSTPVLLGATEQQTGPAMPPATNVPMANGGGAQRNAAPPYRIPAWQALNHWMREMPIRTSALRSLGAFGNVFAAESFMDECALRNGQDGLAHRLRHLDDERARRVTQRVADMAAWGARNLPEGHGLGLAQARYKGNGAYCAVVAEVDATGHRLRVNQLFVAVDVGKVINPDGVKNQIEGGAVQATSWTLLEQVRFGTEGVTSLDWEQYPILRFSEVPMVHVELLDNPHPSVGAGEAAQGPVAAAIANALFQALGVRVRNLPLSPDHIRQAALAATAP